MLGISNSIIIHHQFSEYYFNTVLKPKTDSVYTMHACDFIAHCGQTSDWASEASPLPSAQR